MFFLKKCIAHTQTHTNKQIQKYGQGLINLKFVFFSFFFVGLLDSSIKIIHIATHTHTYDTEIDLFTQQSLIDTFFLVTLRKFGQKTHTHTLNQFPAEIYFLFL